MDRRSYWDDVYRTKGPERVSWFQAEARLSRSLIERSAPDRGARIIDVGAGASTLVAGLLDAGYRQLTVVDLSSTALALAQQRVGCAAAQVSWIAGDALALDVSPAALTSGTIAPSSISSRRRRTGRAMWLKSAAPSRRAATCSSPPSLRTAQRAAVDSRSLATRQLPCTASSARIFASSPASARCTSRPPAANRHSPTASSV